MIQRASMAPVASASYVLCLSGDPRKACRVLRGQTLPFLYIMAAAPIPLSSPDPSEKTLKSALSVDSELIESSLVASIKVKKFAVLLIVTAGWIVSNLDCLSFKSSRSWGPKCVVGG